jgi:hypothetical protein
VTNSLNLKYATHGLGFFSQVEKINTEIKISKAQTLLRNLQRLIVLKLVEGIAMLYSQSYEGGQVSTNRQRYY